jgi:hypothetical protein
MVVFTSTKGKDREIRTPTLATVSLLHVDQLLFPPDIPDAQYEYPPDSKEINRYIAAERLLESLSDSVISFTAGLIELVCEGNLLHVVSGEQPNLHGQLSWYRGQIG